MISKTIISFINMWLGNKKFDDKKTDSEGRERSSQVLNFLSPMYIKMYLIILCEVI